jgi:hypothetical protein
MTYSPTFFSTTTIEKSRALEGFAYPNASGVVLPKGYVVSLGTSGFELVDITNENSVSTIVGIIADDIAVGGNGNFLSNGTLEEIEGLGLSNGPVYLSKTGALTNIKPDIDQPSYDVGDFIVRVGTIITNADNPSKQDLVISLIVRGQL